MAEIDFLKDRGGCDVCFVLLYRMFTYVRHIGTVAGLSGSGIVLSLLTTVVAAVCNGAAPKIQPLAGIAYWNTHSCLRAGAVARRLDFPGSGEVNGFWNKGISACAVCDGAAPLFRRKPLAVIGGGDTAMEEAGFLTKYGSRVYIIHRRDELRASKIMQKRTLENPKIEARPQASTRCCGAWQRCARWVLSANYYRGERAMLLCAIWQKSPSTDAVELGGGGGGAGQQAQSCVGQYRLWTTTFPLCLQAYAAFSRCCGARWWWRRWATSGGCCPRCA